MSIVNPSSTVIDKNEDGSVITQDVDSLVWRRISSYISDGTSVPDYSCDQWNI
jgi:hypothetical protein